MTTSASSSVSLDTGPNPPMPPDALVLLILMIRFASIIVDCILFDCLKLGPVMGREETSEVFIHGETVGHRIFTSVCLVP